MFCHLDWGPLENPANSQLNPDSSVALATELCRRSIHPWKTTSCTAYLTIYDQFCASKLMIAGCLHQQISDCQLILYNLQVVHPLQQTVLRVIFLELFCSTFCSPFFHSKKKNCHLFRASKMSREMLWSPATAEPTASTTCNGGNAMCWFYKNHSNLPKTMYRILFGLLSRHPKGLSNKKSECQGVVFLQIRSPKSGRLHFFSRHKKSTSKKNSNETHLLNLGKEISKRWRLIKVIVHLQGRVRWCDHGTRRCWLCWWEYRNEGSLLGWGHLPKSTNEAYWKTEFLFEKTTMLFNIAAWKSKDCFLISFDCCFMCARASRSNKELLSLQHLDSSWLKKKGIPLKHQAA